MPKISDLPSLNIYYNSGISDMSFVVNGNNNSGDYVTGQFSGSDFTELITDVTHEYLSENISGLISAYVSEGNLDDYISSYVDNGNIDSYLSSYLSENIREYSSYIVQYSGSYDDDVVVRDSEGALYYLSASDFNSKVFSAIYYDTRVSSLDDDTKIVVMDYTDSYDPIFHYLSVGSLIDYIKENLCV